MVTGAKLVSVWWELESGIGFVDGFMEAAEHQGLFSSNEKQPGVSTAPADIVRKTIPMASISSLQQRFAVQNQIPQWLRVASSTHIQQYVNVGVNCQIASPARNRAYNFRAGLKVQAMLLFALNKVQVIKDTRKASPTQSKRRVECRIELDRNKPRLNSVVINVRYLADSSQPSTTRHLLPVSRCCNNAALGNNTVTRHLARRLNIPEMPENHMGLRADIQVGARKSVVLYGLPGVSITY
ncbi:hypothetical protein C8R47DRAFT_1073385 [Mycena vitilis]|nr:hypothetical protein C8R47DRAFT_1073385 [Mycena vitilis]